MSILATPKSVAVIGVECAADFQAARTGGQQLAIIRASMIPL